MFLNMNKRFARTLWVYASSVLFVAGLMVVSTGCGQVDVTDAPAKSSNTNTNESKTGNAVYEAVLKTEQETIANSASQLHGIWWGAAALDEVRLDQAAANMTPEQRNALIAQTRAFASTEMAVHFKPDGTVETAVEVTPPGGQPIAGVTTGTWSVVEARGGRFVVETTESNESGQQSTSRKIFTMLSDSRITLDAPMGDVLATCNPQIVFDRQPDGAANVAEATTETQTK